MRSHNKLALVSVALMILTLVLQSCGLGAEDVPFTVRITNDTSQTVLDHSYFGVYDRTPGALGGGSVVELKPGHSFLETEFVDEGVDPDKISSLSGETLGCLPFEFSEKPPKPLEVNVTEMVPCKHWPAHGNIPKDWPDPNY